MPSQHTIEEVSLKLKKLKQLEEDLLKAISSRVNRLNEESFKALATDSHNVSLMVTLRLDCLSEVLQNLLIKIQDAGQQMDNCQEDSQYQSVLDSVSALAERIKNLETDHEAQGEPNQQVQIQELQASVNKLTNLTEQKQGSFAYKSNDETDCNMRSDLTALRQEVARIDTEKQGLENWMKQQMQRMESENLEMTEQMRDEIERLREEKSCLESQLEQREKERQKLENELRDEVDTVVIEEGKLERHVHQEVKRLDKENQAMETYFKEELKRMKTEKVAMETAFKKQIKHVSAEKLGMEKYLCGEVKRLDTDRKDLQTHIELQVERMDEEKMQLKEELMQEVDKERKSRELHLKQEVDKIVADSHAARNQVQKIVSKQKTFKKMFTEKQTETKEMSAALAKKVSNLEVLRDALTQLQHQGQGQPNTLKMVQDAQKEIISLQSSVGKLDTLMNTNCRQHVGFTATPNNLPYSFRTLQQGQVLNNLDNVICNVGNCFNPHQGQFVAPHDGLYGFCVYVAPCNDTTFVLSLMSQDRGKTEEERSWFRISKGMSRTYFCSLNLLQSTQVWVKVKETYGSASIFYTTAISGWSIGYH